MKYLSIVFVAAITLASCSSARKTQKPGTPPAPQNHSDSMETMSTVLAKINRIEYSTFSGKLDVSYKNSNGKDYNFDAKLNMKKDELIWLSITGPLGIEVARALITTDSVKILNKMEKQYIVSSIDYLQSQLGLPLDLKTVQDLLAGNPIFIDTQNSSYVLADAQPLITSQTRHFKHLLSLMMPGYLPWSSTLSSTDMGNNRSAELMYSNYKQGDNRNFSTERSIKVKDKNTIDIVLKYKSYSFDKPISTPFSVPSGYKRTIK